MILNGVILIVLHNTSLIRFMNLNIQDLEVYYQFNKTDFYWNIQYLTFLNAMFNVEPFLNALRVIKKQFIICSYFCFIS